MNKNRLADFDISIRTLNIVKSVLNKRLDDITLDDVMASKDSIFESRYITKHAIVELKELISNNYGKHSIS